MPDASDAHGHASAGAAPRRMTLRLAPDAASVARFRGDLRALCDIAEDRVLVAVSGGADSVALLLLAHAVLGERCIAATVDHGLRRAAASEAAAVGTWCAARAIEHHTLTGRMPDRAGRTANVSSRARALRYALLERHAIERGAAVIATGHHADDQIETMIMRLNRGAGVSGLAGIRARGGRIVRPLLGWRRAELARLVAACGIAAIDDPTNVDDRYDRARLRKVLGEIGWLDVEHAGASASALGDAEDALSWAARGFEAQYCRFDQGSATLFPERLPFEFRRRLVERCIRQIDPDAAVRGPALIRTVRSLEGDARCTIGDVICDSHFYGTTGWKWVFTPAPPRRSH